VSIGLVAKKMAFNTSTITVPSGAHVTIYFQNQEASGSSQVAGIPHNFALYTSPDATTKLFSGDIVTGGETITYTFTAPATPGTYYFRCDVHPAVMKGQFIVT
jgi:plastocyanin